MLTLPMTSRTSMAASSEENNLPPTEFKLSTSLESFSGLKIAIERCPVCDYSKRPFYCRYCVNQGLFIHSKGTYPERFTDKSHKLEIQTKERDSILEQVQESVHKIKHPLFKREEIDGYRREILLLKLALSAAKDAKNKARKNLETTSFANNLRRLKAKKHRDKKLGISDYVKRVNESNSEKKEKFASIMEELARERRKHIQILTEFIFPVDEVKHRSCSSEDTSLPVSTESALRDASHMTYVRGKWVYTDEDDGDPHYRIIEPTLPCSGDLSAYNIWVANSRENNSNPDNSLRNPGHRISAALCYTSQLVSILSSILVVPVPHRQNYSVFCGAEMMEKNFSNAVACLNQNILYLCFSQGFDDTVIVESKNTLGNLYMLLTSSKIGRAQSFTINVELMSSVGEITQSQEEESEEEKDLVAMADLGDTGALADWEEVTRDFPDISSPTDMNYISTATVQSSVLQSGQQMDNSQLTTSGLMSSAAASVMSLFRGSSTPGKR